MSFLQIPVSRLHPGHQGHEKVIDGQTRVVRKSQSHGGLLNPLLRLAQNPRSAVQELWTAAEVCAESTDEQTALSIDDENRKQLLHVKLKEAKTYSEWRSAASELDKLEGNNAWKEEEVTREYNYALVKSRLQQLDEARTNCDTRRMLFLIRTSLTRGLGGMGSLQLYKHSHIGTKTLIERYIESTLNTLTALLEIAAAKGDDEVDPRHLLDQILQARQSFGRSALLLSGGGTFGMNHVGVVKTLWEAKLLPRIISGASAGSIVAAILCSRTDEELPSVIDEFCYGEMDVFEREGEEDGIFRKLSRFLKHGSLFDIGNLIRVMKNLLGDLTFQEAYNRTRRILNIPVSTASVYELPRLLNYITAPNVIIWSAVAASCSVPLVFSAASLLSKDPRTGLEVPWNPSPGRWIDGSVDNDLPMTRLAEMFNVNHFIVSQVNPHVVPFVNNEASSSIAAAITTGPSWLNSMANLAKDEALHRMHVLTEMGVFPNYFTKIRSVLSQRYAGDITIFPEIDFAQVPQVLANPTTEFMLAALLGGEKATWPKLARVQNHCAIELALDAAVRSLRARVAFSPSQVDLRQSLHGYMRPALQSSSSHIHKREIKRRMLPVIVTPAGPDALAPLTTLSTAKVPHLAEPAAPGLRRNRANQSIRRLSPSRRSFHLQPSSPEDGLVSSSHDDDDDTGPSPFDDYDDYDDDEMPDSESSSTESPPASPLHHHHNDTHLWPPPPPSSSSSRSRHLFPSASQPTTPLLPPSRSSFGLGSPLAMTKASSTHLHSHQNQNQLHTPITPPPCASPSAAELRYKRLFHDTPDPSHADVIDNGDADTNVEAAAILADAKKPPKSKSAAASSSRPGSRPGSRPHSRRGSVSQQSGGPQQQQQQHIGNMKMMQLDISGTRGMMLRRRRSGLFGSGLGSGLGLGLGIKENGKDG
ncbi:patatin-domain-containing protein [Pseudovirgaria hyperparasitica]|uniref:Patatin-domain-containing protein n=1 Tax=Pseudovirgaria hyperparasitica TaxID=470096 RepID=A0A6A6W098_9PEZI|nr:patatin-domain-containing protein [Pseudovirgaria hyperparasitica]KAF2755414.1 patatin-domain-containing protein [Pseudovirgaria hyperparasitica]